MTTFDETTELEEIAAIRVPRPEEAFDDRPDHSFAGAEFGAPPLTRTATTLHTPAEAAALDSPTAGSKVSSRDLALIGGCGLSAFGAVWIVYEKLTRASGALGFWLCVAAVFLLLVYIVIREVDGHLVAVDRVATVVVSAGALSLLVPLVLIIGFVVVRGVHGLHANFFTQDLKTTAPNDPLTKGGALQALVGTLEQVGLAVAISVPLGVLTAVFLNEVRGPMRRPVRLFVDAMSGVPSIVAGLFVYAVLIQSHVIAFSGVAASLALSVLMLPTITRTSEEVLRLVPSGLREASLALGSPQWRTVWSVVLPTARSGLVTAVVLGIARAVGETAPLLLTSFGNQVINGDPFSKAQDALPLFIYREYKFPFQVAEDRAFTGALVLVVLVLVLFTVARIAGNRQPGRRSALARLMTRPRPTTRRSR